MKFLAKKIFYAYFHGEQMGISIIRRNLNFVMNILLCMVKMKSAFYILKL